MTFATQVEKYLTMLSGMKPSIEKIGYGADMGTSYFYDATYLKGTDKFSINIEHFTKHPPYVIASVYLNDNCLLFETLSINGDNDWVFEKINKFLDDF